MLITAPPTNRFTIEIDGLAILDDGITMYPADPPLLLKIVDLGTAIQQPIQAISAVAAQRVNVIEFLLEP